MKIYTKTGDSGDTGLQGGMRISKSHSRIAAYGAVDEANAALGVAMTHAKKSTPDVAQIIAGIQDDLFVVGADLSNPNLGDLRHRVTPEMTSSLEALMDRLDSKLSALENFILPGGDLTAAHLHLARAIIRRAETLVVGLGDSEEINLQCLIYLNRLSDALFVLARTANEHAGCAERPWKPA